MPVRPRSGFAARHHDEHRRPPPLHRRQRPLLRVEARARASGYRASQSRSPGAPVPVELQRLRGSTTWMNCSLSSRWRTSRGTRGAAGSPAAGAATRPVPPSSDRPSGGRRQRPPCRAQLQIGAPSTRTPATTPPPCDPCIPLHHLPPVLRRVTPRHCDTS